MQYKEKVIQKPELQKVQTKLKKAPKSPPKSLKFDDANSENSDNEKQAMKNKGQKIYVVKFDTSYLKKC